MLFTVLDVCIMIFIIIKMMLATLARKKKTGMAEGGDSSAQSNWRDKIISQIQNRNRQQCSCFQELITFRKFIM